MSHLKIPLPSKGQGTGANLGVVKADIIRALIEHLFPDDSRESREDLIRSLSPPPRKKKKKAEEDNEEAQILTMISQLDPENAEAYKKISQYARERLEESYIETGRQQGVSKTIDEVKAALEKEGIDISVEQPSKEKPLNIQARSGQFGRFGLLNCWDNLMAFEYIDFNWIFVISGCKSLI